ncbi:hypothetical protein IMZ11_41895 [Microtetraspora sp. AC03309]|uniref:hypothetical protein n=1 Tax=Microtetraspora sp. AC03309 TaxID=2779376 RepID=UPI001E5E03BB|nr:hypothetical protein [Microtetraspora sp. AC03309]MCC5582164.1 hypothetical protein [Microtetraspora sp. AC03309]
MSLYQADTFQANAEHYLSGIYSGSDGERIARAIAAQTSATLAVASALQEIAEALRSMADAPR